MTAHPNKAEFLVWLEDPEYWCWQWRASSDHDWYTDRKPPLFDTTLEYRLVPRPWLEEPEKWDVYASEAYCANSDEWYCGGEPAWDHSKHFYRLKPRQRTVYQKRVEVPEPYRGEMEERQEYYTPAPELPHGYRTWNWFQSDGACRFHKEHDLIHLVPEDAAARGKAMGEIE